MGDLCGRIETVTTIYFNHIKYFNKTNIILARRAQRLLNVFTNSDIFEASRFRFSGEKFQNELLFYICCLFSVVQIAVSVP
jgi:hypothetical protein